MQTSLKLIHVCTVIPNPFVCLLHSVEMSQCLGFYLILLYTMRTGKICIFMNTKTYWNMLCLSYSWTYIGVFFFFWRKSVLSYIVYGKPNPGLCFQKAMNILLSLIKCNYQSSLHSFALNCDLMFCWLQKHYWIQLPVRNFVWSNNLYVLKCTPMIWSHHGWNFL